MKRITLELGFEIKLTSYVAGIHLLRLNKACINSFPSPEKPVKNVDSDYQ